MYEYFYEPAVKRRVVTDSTDPEREGRKKKKGDYCNLPPRRGGELVYR